MMKVFYDDWESLEDMKSDFRISDEDLTGVKVLFASYTYENYQGSATVLFEKDDKLFEVIGSHCSCYGLEDQWEPTETCIAVIEKMVSGEIWVDGNHKQAMSEVLKYLQDK